MEQERESDAHAWATAGSSAPPLVCTTALGIRAGGRHAVIMLQLFPQTSHSHAAGGRTLHNVQENWASDLELPPGPPTRHRTCSPFLSGVDAAAPESGDGEA